MSLVLLCQYTGRVLAVGTDEDAIAAQTPDSDGFIYEATPEAAEHIVAHGLRGVRFDGDRFVIGGNDDA